ncbi:phage GP46 family protein [Bradyrhizobium elkanii]|uniref:phage GP46 family protein n=1 Tax=Bradyrhizobium elkanii TaxID=29448 RepID=UPI0004ADF22B|nr:phage GP46 family protein [Bradyrhizobium elkanii]WLA79568.1 phage GP46 family protein [Bradyrhizobium elkanii]
MLLVDPNLNQGAGQRLLIGPCLEQNVGRRRIFWTTRADACGSYILCGNECSIPGLEYENNEVGRTIKNDEWLRSLILNILNTRARTDIRCPSPAAIYGHWSESYRDDGLYIGSRLWNAAAKNYIRIADAVKAIQAAISADMAKLTVLGVADAVNVEATYRGRNQVEVIITATRTNDRHVLNLSGSFVSGSWAWT